MRLCVIRHADPAYPADRLSERGRREAAALAERLAAHGLDRLYTSPMTRARETAAPVAAACGLPAEELEWVREVEDWWLDEGPMPEWPAWNLDGADIRRMALQGRNWLDRRPFDKPVLAEGFERLERESDRFLAGHGYVREGHRYRVAEGHRERIAVVCHAGLALSWLGHLLHIPVPLVWAGFFLAPSSVTTVLLEERSADWAVPRCLAVGDTSHLLPAGLAPGSCGLVANCE
ncbi:MAG TPA: histidine phosphatase family protein [Thermoanaerobaculia bacterium]|nr:histidine phosphatase family protein [Thermoanaerobaculia bacterium]